MVTVYLKGPQISHIDHEMKEKERKDNKTRKRKTINQLTGD